MKHDMLDNLDDDVSASTQIEGALCARLERIRLARNITQVQLAERAGVATRTITRLEKGEGISLDTFIRVLMALGLQQNLSVLLPDPTVRPMERISALGRERQRARPRSVREESPSWSWGDSDESEDA